MALWKSSLNPFVTILPHTSPAVLPMILDIPGLQWSIHIGIYLPTRGLEHEWVIALAALTLVLEYAQETYPSLPIYIKGDSNVNPNHQVRKWTWDEVLQRFGLSSLDIGHHFR